MQRGHGDCPKPTLKRAEVSGHASQERPRLNRGPRPTGAGGGHAPGQIVPERPRAGRVLLQGQEEPEAGQAGARPTWPRSLSGTCTTRRPCEGRKQGRHLTGVPQAQWGGRPRPAVWDWTARPVSSTAGRFPGRAALRHTTSALCPPAPPLSPPGPPASRVLIFPEGPGPLRPPSQHVLGLCEINTAGGSSMSPMTQKSPSDRTVHSKDEHACTRGSWVDLTRT